MKNSRINEVIEFVKKYYKIISVVLIVLMLPLIYLFVYSTGGIKYVYSHSMYIPILLAGIIIGPKFGVFIALSAGILLGPLMPIDTVTNEPQIVVNWMYRLVIFMIIGFTSGHAFHKIKMSKQRIDELMSHNQETNIPNTNFLKRIPSILKNDEYSLMTVLINNHNNIIDVLGTDIYHILLNQIYTELTSNLKDRTLIIQSDSNKLWVMKPYLDLTNDAKYILSILNKQWIINDIPLYVDFSIGATHVEHGFDLMNLDTFESADNSARYAQLNNISYMIHDENKLRKKSDYALLATFKHALETNQTFLTYQPKIDLNTMKPYGLEALIRWHHPEKGLIMPDSFIPLVEETKLIHLLTDWVLTNTLYKIKAFRALGIEVPISINVSAKNLYDPFFFERVMKNINSSGVDKKLIKFEITESVLMINPEESKNVLEKLVKHGVLIELDDFGSGYSSLAYLTQFPISTIKIDRLFMQKILINSQVRQIVKSAIQLSKDLGYKVVAEGVETAEVLDVLKEFNCDYAQGYYFAKPIASEEIEDWYRKALQP
ncbi:MAG: hypothetical protein CVV57_08070 [Tenericutes bacterium HGW-Tenericutes-2]|jgi:EAL domain-containing protein (putative c-di-GMP-specific phosphodiesterase class I)|nr:MAG: hypothetical protein CVV57_08070 [Tenericutes bacterium HGW-Tenericutes-2]